MTVEEAFDELLSRFVEQLPPLPSSSSIHRIVWELFSHGAVDPAAALRVARSLGDLLLEYLKERVAGISVSADGGDLCDGLPLFLLCEEPAAERRLEASRRERIGGTLSRLLPPTPPSPPPPTLLLRSGFVSPAVESSSRFMKRSSYEGRGQEEKKTSEMEAASWQAIYLRMMAEGSHKRKRREAPRGGTTKREQPDEEEHVLSFLQEHALLTAVEEEKARTDRLEDLLHRALELGGSLTLPVHFSPKPVREREEKGEGEREGGKVQREEDAMAFIERCRRERIRLDAILQ